MLMLFRRRKLNSANGFDHQRSFRKWTAVGAGQDVWKAVVRFVMPEYDVLKEILGKTIKGVIVKQNMTNTRPIMSIHLIFSDDTSYEIYSDYGMCFAGGIDRGDMDSVRKYGIYPKGPMENVLDITIDETNS